MARSRALDVWLHGQHVAVLTEPRPFRYRLEWTEEALDRYGVGARPMSLSLPVGTRPITDSDRRPVSSFLEGLLPEGNLRSHLATIYNVTVIDKMGLLTQVGKECAGAIQFLPRGERPGAGDVRPLTAREVDRLIADLPTYHVPEGSHPQASLAGLQDKVLLTALPGGGWGWPEQGAASTHIVKPEPLTDAVVPHLIESEHWALRVADAAGLPAAQTRLASFDGRTAIIITRYDRCGGDDGAARLHQEDFCQALGLDPQAKYESMAEFRTLGSRLSRVASLAAGRAQDPVSFRLDLLRAVTFNIMIGNGDAHSKNYSLLLDEQGAVSLAPLYDTAPVMDLDRRFRGTSHVINGTTSIDAVTIADLVREGSTWGVPALKAEREIRETLLRVSDAVARVAPAEVISGIRERMAARWRRSLWPTTAPDGRGSRTSPAADSAGSPSPQE